MNPTRRRSWTLILSTLLLLAFTGRCGGGGCDLGCGALAPIPGGYPAGEVMENGIQIRLSSSGITMIEGMVPDLVAGLIPGGTSFPVPAICDIALGIDVCGTGDTNNCTPDNPACSIEIDIGDVSITPTAPNQLNATVMVNIATPPAIPLVTHGLASCYIHIDTSLGNTNGIPADVTVTFNVDAQSKRTSIDIGAVNIDTGAIEAGVDLSIEAVNWWDILLCDGILNNVQGLIIDQLAGQISGMIDPLIADMTSQLCMPCDQGEPCPAGSACNGTSCMEDSDPTNKCVQPLGMEGRFDLGGMLGSIAPGKKADMDLMIWLGGRAAAVNNGFSLGMLGGVNSPVHNECVPLRPAPPVSPRPSFATELDGNTRPDGAPFHVGIGIHKRFLDRVGWSIYDNGLLCLQIGPREVDMLTSGTFDLLLMGNLAKLTHNVESPIVIATRPQHPFTFELHSDPEMVLNPSTGEYDIITPNLTVHGEDFAIDFYTLIDYHWVRLFRAYMDIALPLGLTVNGQNQLVPVMGDIGDAIVDIEIADATSSGVDPAVLESLFPTLLGMVGGLIGDSLIPPIDLPDLQGFTLELDDGSFTTVDGTNIMAIFANLSYTAPAPKAKRGQLKVATNAELVAQYVPAAESFHFKAFGDHRKDPPTITLALGGTAPDGSDAPLEWQYRFDSGLWSPFTDSPVVTLTRATFWLQGWHDVEVRARIKGQPRTLDNDAVTLRFLVDRTAPKVGVIKVNGALRLELTDNLTDPGKLEVSILRGDGSFSPWQMGLSEITRPPMTTRLVLRVRDEAGNVTTHEEPLLGLYGRVTLPPSDGGGCGLGCAQTNSSGAALWLGFVIMGLLGLRRRRRIASLLPFVVVAASVSLAAGCKTDSPGANNNNACGDATVIPLVCADPAPICDPEFQEVVSASTLELDPVTCEPIPVTCTCDGDIPQPIDPMDIGRYLSVAAGGGDVYVSCYSDRHEDLVITLMDTESGVLIPEAVDGVPDNGSITGEPEGYRGGTNAKGPDVGRFTSAQLAADGTLYVSYTTTDEGTLKLAYGTPGDWTIHEVETYAAEYTKARFTALKLLPDGTPAIAYMVTGLPDPNTSVGRVSELRWAVANSATPGAAGDWTIRTVDASRTPCAGMCDADMVCLAANWTCANEDAGGCGGGCADGEACVANACEAILEEASWADALPPDGVGLWVNAELLTDGRAALAYYVLGGHGSARVAVGDASGFAVTTFDGANSVTDIGQHISLTVDASDGLHVAYTDAVRDELIYAELDVSGAVQVREVVNAGGNPGGTYTVGAGATIVLVGGSPFILFQDAELVEIWSATRNGADDWSYGLVKGGAPSNGFWLDATIDAAGTLWVAEYSYDWDAEQLTSLQAYPLP